MPDFSLRSNELELMDHPIEDVDAIQANFDDLHVINRWLGGAQHSLTGIRQLAGGKALESVLDVGSGGGDLVSTLDDQHVADRILALDQMPEAHGFLRDRHPNLKRVETITSSYEDWFDSGEKADVIHAALFCHHLSDEQLVDFLKRAKRAARTGVVINDLHRHPFAYHSIHWLTKGLATSYFTKHDAPLSVLRGFRRRELERLLERAGITNYRLTWKWAFRYLIVIPS